MVSTKLWYPGDRSYSKYINGDMNILKDSNKEFFIAHTHGFFNLSMSVCDEKFFVRINIYHSDERDSSII